MRRQFQEAVKTCRLGLLAHPTFIEGRLVLGMALMALSRFDEVLAEMRVAQELAPDNAMVFLLKGEALYQKRDYRQAVKVLKAAQELAPLNEKIQKLLIELERITHDSANSLNKHKTQTRVYPARQQQKPPMREVTKAIIAANGRSLPRAQKDKPPPEDLASWVENSSNPIETQAEAPPSKRDRMGTLPPPGGVLALGEPDGFEDDDAEYTTAPFLPPPNIPKRLYAHDSHGMPEDWAEPTFPEEQKKTTAPPVLTVEDPTTERQGQLGSQQFSAAFQQAMVVSSSLSSAPKTDTDEQAFLEAAGEDDSEEQTIESRFDEEKEEDKERDTDRKEFTGHKQEHGVVDETVVNVDPLPAIDRPTDKVDPLASGASPAAASRAHPRRFQDRTKAIDLEEYPISAVPPEKKMSTEEIEDEETEGKEREKEAESSALTREKAADSKDLAAADGQEHSEKESLAPLALAQTVEQVHMAELARQSVRVPSNPINVAIDMQTPATASLSSIAPRTPLSSNSARTPTPSIPLPEQVHPVSSAEVEAWADDSRALSERSASASISEMSELSVEVISDSVKMPPVPVDVCLGDADIIVDDSSEEETRALLGPTPVHQQKSAAPDQHHPDQAWQPAGLWAQEADDEEESDGATRVHFEAQEQEDVLDVSPPRQGRGDHGRAPEQLDHRLNDRGGGQAGRLPGRSEAFNPAVKGVARGENPFIPPGLDEPYLDEDSFPQRAPRPKEGYAGADFADQPGVPGDPILDYADGPMLSSPSIPEYEDEYERSLEPADDPEEMVWGPAPKRTEALNPARGKVPAVLPIPPGARKAPTEILPEHAQVPQRRPHREVNVSPAVKKQASSTSDDPRVFLKEAAARAKKRKKQRPGARRSIKQTSLLTVIMGAPGSLRWVFLLLGALVVLVAAVGVGLAVRYLRLEDQIKTKRKLVQTRLWKGNLPDFTAAAQNYAFILARRPKDEQAVWAHAWIQAAIPFEFGDPNPQARPLQLDHSKVKLVEHYTAKIYSLLNKGSLVQASKLVKQARGEFPKSALLEYLQGRVYLLEGNGMSATRHLQRAHQLEPKNLLIVRSLGDSFLEQGKYSDAMRSYQAGLKHNAEHIASLLGKAKVGIATLRSPTDAVEVDKDIGTINRSRQASRGQRGWAFLLLAKLNIKRGYIDQSKENINQAKQNDPILDPLFFEELASALIDSYQLGEAEKFIQRSKAIMSGRPHPYYWMANLRMLQGTPQAALKELEQAKGIRFAASNALRAKIHLMLGKLDIAEEEVNQALTMSATLLEANIIKAKILARRGQGKEGQNLLIKLLKDYPQSSKVLTAQGEIYLQIGKTQEARRVLSEALRVDQHAFEAQLMLALVDQKEGNYQEALKRLHKVHRENYGNIAALKELSRLEADMGDLTEAATNFQTILDRVPTEVQSRLELIRVYTLQRKFTKAEQEITKITRQKVDAISLALVLGRLDLRRGKAEQAIPSLKKAMKHPLYEREALDLLVQAYLLNKQEGEARATAKELSQKTANGPDGAVAMGRIELAAGNPTSALASLKRAEGLLESTPHPPMMRASVLVLLGTAYQESGQLSKAEETYHEAIRICSMCAEPHYRRGLVQDERGSVTEALASLAEAIKLDPSFVEAYYDQGQILERDGQNEKAIESYRMVLKISPYDEWKDSAQQAIQNLQGNR